MKTAMKSAGKPLDRTLVNNHENILVSPVGGGPHDNWTGMQPYMCTCGGKARGTQNCGHTRGGEGTKLGHKALEKWVFREIGVSARGAMTVASAVSG